jgi:cytoskeletal protein RodZ
MRTSKKLFLYLACSGLCAFLFSGAFLQAAAQAGEQSPTDKMVEASAANQPRPDELPDSPGAVLTRSTGSPTPQDGGTPSTPVWSSSQRDSATQIAQAEPPQNQTPSTPQKPVGTATAEAPDTSGIAASQPAGAAVAPAKQRRVRTIVIKVGAIAAGAVALGTVVALTEATSSKPPGAH